MTPSASFPVAFALLCAYATAAVIDGHAAQPVSMLKPAFRRLTTERATESESFDRLSSRVIDISHATPLRRDGESAVDLVLPKTNHQSSGSGNCAFTDYACITIEALKQVNIIRAQVRVAPFAIGTISQLGNAVRYSQQLSRLGFLKHQNLRTTSLGCNTFFSGENIAQSWARAPVNVARKCVLQLRGSPPHYKNMISTYHKFFVMGIYIEPSGKLWCVQTFGIRTRFGTGRCKAVGV